MHALISPSQIEMYRTCPRKWALRYIFKAPKSPQSKASKFGDDVEAAIYRAIDTGGTAVDWQDPEPGRLALEMVPHIPVVGLERQKEIALEIDQDLTIIGRLDFFVDRDPRPLVGDIKTRSKIEYVMTREKMPDDPQCVIYAYAASRGREGVDLHWCTGLTRVKVDRVRNAFDSWTSSQAEDYAEPMLDTARKMRALKVLNPASTSDVECNVSGCGQFGGCSYSGNLCQLDPNQMLERAFGGNQMSFNLMDQFKNATSTAAPNAPSPTGGVPALDLGALFGAAGTPAPVRDPMAEALERAEKGAHPLPGGSVAPNGRPLPPTVCRSGIVYVGATPRGVRELAESDGQEALIAALNAAADAHAMAASTPQSVLPPEAATAPTAAQAQAAPAAAAEAPKKRGRPRGSKSTAASEVTLYIGCAPIGEDYTQIEEVYDRAHQKIAEEKGVLDFGLLSYGEGPAAFRVFAKAAFDAAGKGAFVVADPSSRESAIALPTIAAAADVVVRSFR